MHFKLQKTALNSGGETRVQVTQTEGFGLSPPETSDMGLVDVTCQREVYSGEEIKTKGLLSWQKTKMTNGFRVVVVVVVKHDKKVLFFFSTK